MGADLARDFAPERQQDSVNLFEAVAAHAAALQKAGKRVLFASWTDGSSDRLASMLGDHGLKGVRFAKDWADVLGHGVAGTKQKPIQRVILPVEHGFTTDDLAVISEADILGDRLARPRRKRRASNFLAEATSLTPGDLVVHIDHGIGRYDGLRTLDVAGAPHDCLDLQYGAEAKLYLPVENIDLLTRYGSESEGVQLDKLGGAQWQARKSKAKERLRVMAEGLIAIAAARALKQGEEVDPPTGLFDEFCARFPYEETDDQLNAIGDVLGDLASGKPMDRLICGDVGFGKTEVALRAAFVVAMSGRQVAVVCPTTLLARQHFKTFSERLRRLADQGAPALPHGPRQGGGRDPRQAEDRRGRGGDRHPRHPGLQRRVQGPRHGDRGRGAALRRQAQGAAEGAAGRRPHAHAHRHAHPAHAADGAVGHPRDVDHRHPPRRPLGRAHLRAAVRSHSPSARRYCARSTAAARPISWSRA